MGNEIYYGLKVNYCIEQYGGHWWFGKSRKIIAVKEDSNQRGVGDSKARQPT